MRILATPATPVVVTLAIVLPGVLGGLGCHYNPPPDINLGCTETVVDDEAKLFVQGEPIRLCFSERIRVDSLAIRVWPGRKDLFDVEGERLPDVVPLIDDCSQETSPCGDDGGVELRFAEDGREASLLVAPGALGPLSQPLQLEVTGQLSDTKGHRRKVSRFWDFQIVAEAWNPFSDTSGGNSDIEEPPDGTSAEDIADVAPPEPMGIVEGMHLFCADFTDPLPLSQQFFGDFQVNQLTGEFVAVLVDADPAPGAIGNTCVPEELVLDKGDEGFLFTVRGQITRDADGGLVFVTDFVTLVQTIGITFELRDMVLRGRIAVDDATGRSRWDGTMAVRQVVLRVGDQETIYDDVDHANFQIFEIRGDEIPEGTAATCDADPCLSVGGKCDLLTGVAWPPEQVCSEDVPGAL